MTDEIVTKTIQINASPSTVWNALTTPAIMKKWMSDSELDIITDWRVGSPIHMHGRSHAKFVNKGTILQFEPEKTLQYTHLSSLSRLPDSPESYAHFEFQLTPTGRQTTLTLTATNFPTQSIHKHLAHYWNVALEVLKRLLEEQAKPPTIPSTPDSP